MARAWRIEYEGALYHLLSRGNERRDIFLDNTDRARFLDTVGEMSERFEVEVFAYVLMDNHYHLLVRTRQANLKKAMQWFGATYTTRFNHKHDRNGHLFQGRYKSMLVQNDAYLLQLSFYIHRNPLRSGIVNRLADYRWSSYRAYAYDKSKPPWLSTELILSQFDGRQPHRAYREKVQRYAEEEKWLWEDLHHGIFLGSKQFVTQIRKRHLREKPDKEMPEQKRSVKEFGPADLLYRAAAELRCDLNHLSQLDRVTGLQKDNRDLLIYSFWNIGLLTNAKIGDLFGVSYSAVSHSVKAVKSKLQHDRELKTKLDRINSLFKI